MSKNEKEFLFEEFNEEFNSYREGKDELNIAEFPLASISNLVQITTKQ